MTGCFLMRDPSTYPCPCCGDLVFDEEPGSYDILRIQCQQEYANSRNRFEEPRHGVDYDTAYADDSTVYYSWRSRR